ncbi:MAG: fibronectin type III domain-containing protein [Aureispira sp.]
MRNLINYLLLLTTIWGLSATTSLGQNCPPTTNISSMTTPNGTTVSWDANTAAQQYELRYREVGTSALSYATTNTNSFTFTNLQPNICYEFAVRTVCDSINLGPWSPGQSFCVPGSSGFCAQPSNITSTTTSNAANLNWPAVSNAQFYEIRYREVGTSALSFATTNTNSLTLSGLMASTCYEFAMRTGCDTSNFSSWTTPAQQFCTNPPAQACILPTNVSATPSPNGVVINWTAVSNAIGYELRYREVGTSTLLYTSVPANRAVINNLMANTCYEYSIRTQCDTNTYSDWLIPALGFCVPGSTGLCLTPSNITSSTGTNVAVLNWMPMNNAIAYEIRYREVGTSTLTYVSSNSSVVTLGNLMAGTCYEFSIRTQCDTNSFSPWLIPAQQFCTDPDTTNVPCTLPSGIVSMPSVNDAVITWMAQSNAIGYELRYRQVGTSALSYTSVSANRAILSNLMAGTCYEFSIRTQCDTNTYSDWLTPALSFCTDTVAIVPCMLPSNINDSIGQTYNLIYWSNMSNAQGYEIRYREVGTTALMVVSTNDNSLFLSGLDPGTCYEYSIRTICDSASNDFSPWLIPARTFCTDSIVIPTCPTPMGLQVDTVTTNTAAVSWMSTVSNFGYEVRYAMIGGTFTVVPTTSPSTVLQNLAAGSCYTVNVRTVCSPNGSTTGNISAWSPPVTFCTDSIVVPTCPVPTGVQADSVGSNFAVVSWMSNGTNFGYEVRYNDPNTSASDTLFTNSSSIVLQNLAANTCYIVEVRTICGTGPIGNIFSPWSTPVTFCTDSIVVPTCPTPMGVQTDSVGSNFAVVSWMSNGTNFGYEVRYNNPNTSASDTLFTNSSSIVLQNLAANTCYNVEVRTICGTGPIGNIFSPWSTLIRFCTDSIVVPTCPVPTGVQADSTTTTLAFLSWVGNATNFGYEVRYAVPGTAYTTMTVGVNPSVVLQNLMAGTCYTFNVRTICDTSNFSAWSTPVTFCTDSIANTPCLPTRNTYTNMNATFGLFTWDPVPGAISYRVRFRVFNDTTFYTSLYTVDTAAFYQGFTPGTCYEYNVLTQCDTTFGPTGNPIANFSAWSALDTFCTPTMMVNPNGSGNGTATDAFQTIGNGEDNGSLRYNLFPNPTTGAVTIKFERDLNTDYTIRVFNVLGAEVTPVALERGAATCTFNLSHLNNGLYMVEVSTAQKSWTQRVQVLK